MNLFLSQFSYRIPFLHEHTVIRLRWNGEENSQQAPGIAVLIHQNNDGIHYKLAPNIDIRNIHDWFQKDEAEILGEAQLEDLRDIGSVAKYFGRILWKIPRIHPPEEGRLELTRTLAEALDCFLKYERLQILEGKTL